MFDLSKEIVLVTGASRGIGKAISHFLAQCGAKVVGTSQTSEGAKQISASAKDLNLGIFGYQLNIKDRNSAKISFDTISTEVGAISVLINNAGITNDNLILRMQDDAWDSVLETNLTGAFNITKLCIKNMVKAKRGRIINIGSVVGSMGNAGQCNYAASKAGLIGFSKSLSKELASRNITCNVIAPGFIESDMTAKLNKEQTDNIFSMIPLKRFGQPIEIAYLCAFLASDMGSYITGEVIQIAGGMNF